MLSAMTYKPESNAINLATISNDVYISVCNLNFTNVCGKEFISSKTHAKYDLNLAFSLAVPSSCTTKRW